MADAILVQLEELGAGVAALHSQMSGLMALSAELAGLRRDFESLKKAVRRHVERKEKPQKPEKPEKRNPLEPRWAAFVEAFRKTWGGSEPVKIERIMALAKQGFFNLRLIQSNADLDGLLATRPEFIYRRENGVEGWRLRDKSDPDFWGEPQDEEAA